MLGIGAIVGTGIFVLTGVVAAKHSGPAIILSFAIAALACALLHFVMLNSLLQFLSQAVCIRTHMRRWESIRIFNWMGLNAGVFTRYICCGKRLVGLFPIFIKGFGIHIPTILSSAPGTGKGGIIDLPAVLIILVMTVLLSRGVRESARVNNIMVFIKIAVVLIFIFAGFNYVKPENWTPFMPFGLDGVMAGAATVFFAFIGFDAVSTAAEEVKRPQRDLPIGIIASLLICTVLYIVVSLILTGIVPYGQLNISDPVAFALQFIGQDSLAGVISVGAITGITTVMLVMMYGQVRVSYAMSRDGLLPKRLAKVHQNLKHRF